MIALEPPIQEPDFDEPEDPSPFDPELTGEPYEDYDNNAAYKYTKVIRLCNILLYWIVWRTSQDEVAIKPERTTIATDVKGIRCDP